MNIPALSISSASSEDLPTIIALAHRIWPVCFAGNLTPEQIANMLEKIYNGENLSQEMQRGHRFFIAHDGKEPVGYASAYKENDIIWIKKIYILPEQQGKGIGTKLLDAIISALKPASEQRLLVNRENKPAQKFYLRSGFTCIGEVPVQMGDHHFIDLVYAKEL